MHNLKSDIEKYLNGELTPAEMHALEKKALSDPFLADALEGAGSLETGDLAQDMQVLHAALDERTETKKGRVIPLWTWVARIAAGVLLLVASTYIIVNLTGKDEEHKQLAENKQGPAVQAPAATDTIQTEEGDSALKNQQYRSMAEEKKASNPQPKTQQANALSRREQPASVASAGAASEPGITVEETERITEDVFAEKIATGDVATVERQDSVVLGPQKSEIAKDDRVVTNSKAARGYANVADEKSDKKEKASRKKEESYDARLKYAAEDDSKSRDKALPVVSMLDADGKNIVRGRVTSSEDGSGIPAVNVVIKGTEKGTITDVDGNYEIELTQPSATLVYSFIGLESTERPVVVNQQIDVAMNEDVSQLSEVVVTGYGEGDEAETELSTFEMAAPAGGRKAFKKYLEQTITYPQIAIDNKVEGKVTVQFVVDTYGKLTDFKVVKGIGYGCDEEVIRLIREGPAWTPMKRDDEPIRGKIRVRMRFSLPEKKK